MLLYKKHLQDNYQVAGKDWDNIKDYIDPVSIHKNEYFVKKGKVCHRMGFVAEGVLRFCMERDGKDITCYFASENNFVGDPDSFYTRKPSDKNVHALTDCLLMCISYENMKKVLGVYPRFAEV